MGSEFNPVEILNISKFDLLIENCVASEIYFWTICLKICNLVWKRLGRAGRYMFTFTGDLSDNGDTVVGVVLPVIGMYPTN